MKIDKAKKDVISWYFACVIVIPIIIILLFSVPYQAITDRDLQLHGKIIDAKIIDLDNVKTKSGWSKEAKFEYKVESKVYTIWLGVSENAKIGDSFKLKYAPHFPWHARYDVAVEEEWDKNLVERILISLFLGLFFSIVLACGVISARKKLKS